MHLAIRMLLVLAVGAFVFPDCGKASVVFKPGKKPEYVGPGGEEELSGDAVKTAKAAADTGVKIFTIGVGTPQGSLIPVNSDDGGTAFVKDSAGQVVKSKLDEKRLRDVAQATGGFYLHLDDGPRTMS